MDLLKITFLNAGSIFGRILPNFLADRFGAYNMLLPCLFISSALVFSMLAINRLAELVTFGILYGFWSGSCRFLLLPWMAFWLNSRMCRRISYSVIAGTAEYEFGRTWVIT